jgi:hypothetical protein
MKKLILISLLGLFTGASFAKGSSGKYYIAGKARDNKNNILANKVIIVDFKGEKKEIRTDSAGNYIITIPWMFACPSKLSSEELANTNELLNPKWIWLSYDGIKIKIENEWKSYGRTDVKNEDEITRKLDLKFE